VNSPSVSNFIDISHWQLNPYQILTIGYSSVILLGALLLMLPQASKSGLESLAFIDALFTATSAVCVTGLIVVDTGNYFSLFGQMVIILLIQIGGLGIMTLTTLMAIVLGRRIQLSNRLLIQESLNQLTVQGVVRLVLYIFKVTVLIEFVGGTILGLRFAVDYGWQGIYYGYWHAVSAFCNAGFDVFGGATFFRYIEDPIVNLTIAGLIILGGIGFAVMADVWQKRRWRNLTVQSKVVLSTTAFLLLLGLFGILLLEYDNAATIGSLPLQSKILASFFQSASARTAGYQMFNNGLLGESSLLFVVLLMFIGASPGSTGGGIKTSTFAIIVASISSMIRGKSEVRLFSRAIEQQVIIKALSLFFIAATLVFFVTLYLCVTENLPLIQVVYEVVSAFATVGLSTGITSSLTVDGKFILIIMMLIGRVGVFTFGMALAMRAGKKEDIHHPFGKFSIG